MPDDEVEMACINKFIVSDMWKLRMRPKKAK